MMAPDGPFLEVPYVLRHHWTRGGYTWPALVAAGGLLSIVVDRLSPRDRIWVASGGAVRLWPSLDDYRRETGAEGCRPGRAWYGPAPAGDPLPIAFLTGCMDPPVRTSGSVGRRRYRW